MTEKKECKSVKKNAGVLFLSIIKCHYFFNKMINMNDYTGIYILNINYC